MSHSSKTTTENPDLGSQGWVTVNNVTLRYELSGQGARTIVLLHEMGGTMQIWDEIKSDLCKENRVLRYDLRGFGLSEKLVHETSFDDAIEDLRALLEELDIQGPVTLVGSAIGGTISLIYAARYPEQVECVIASSPPMGTPKEFQPEAMKMADRLEKGTIREMVFPPDLDDNPPEVRNNPALMNRIDALRLINDSRSMASFMRMIARLDIEDELPLISCPTLFVGATLYKLRPLDVQRKLAGLVPGSEFIEVQLGHLMPAQSPETFLNIIKDFLRSQKPA